MERNIDFRARLTAFRRVKSAEFLFSNLGKPYCRVVPKIRPNDLHTKEPAKMLA